MPTNIEVRLGLTPMFKRLAYSFLTKGLGRHLLDHPLYDEVVVAELYPWQTNPERTDEYGAGIVVTFYKDGNRIRSAEFSARCTGGGGDAAIFRV
jgi:hypothetical protein